MREIEKAERGALEAEGRFKEDGSLATPIFLTKEEREQFLDDFHSEVWRVDRKFSPQG